jgi:WD40 repeat protein
MIDDEQSLDTQLELLRSLEETWLSGVDSVSLPKNGDPECLARLERNLAFARRLEQIFKPGDGAANPGASTDEALPWKQLGRFQLRRELGRGGCGLVFLAYDPLLDREVALKVPRAEIAASEELRARFRNEARAAAALDHPNLVRVYEAGEVGPVLFLVSAYAPGITLDRWLAEREVPVPPRFAAKLVATLAEAVEHAHAHGVLHRDLKPSNVLLELDSSGEDGEPTPKIFDFGLARLTARPAEALTHTGAILGTVNYMAPEQAAGSRRLGPEVDVYALGVILYELLTSQLPVRGANDQETLQRVLTWEPSPLTDLRPDVPAALSIICRTCLEKPPSRRYSSAGALAEDLRKYLAGQSLRAQEPARCAWLRGWPGRAMLVGLAASMLVSMLWIWREQLRLDAFPLAIQPAGLSVAPALQASADARPARPVVQLSPDQLCQRGRALCEQGHLAPGLLCLSHALVSAPEHESARAGLVDWHAQLDYQLVQIIPHSAKVRAAAFSADGLRVATASDDRTVRIHDVASGNQQLPALQHESPVQAVAFSPRADLLLSGCRDGNAYFWSMKDGARWGNPLSHDGEIWAVAFNPGGETALSGGWDRLVRCWDVATQTAQGDSLSHDSAVMSLAYSPGGQTIVTGSRDKKAWLWDATTHRRLEPLLPHGGPVYATAFDSMGSLLLTAGGEGLVRFWHSTTLSPQGSALPHDAPIHSLAVSSRGEFLLGSDAHDCLRCDLASRTLLGKLPNVGPCKTVAYSPGGTHAIVGGPRTARLWKLFLPASRDPVVEGSSGSRPSLPADPDQALLSIEVRTGYELDENGAARALDVGQWIQRRDLLASLVQARP